MSVVRRIARPLLAAIFVESGLDAYRHPAARARAAKPLVQKMAGPLGLPDDPELLVRANGAAQAGAGALLALGRFPRLSSLVLALSLVPTTLAAHRFWEVDDSDQRRMDRTHFLKNAGLLGGLLIASLDTEGRPGLTWRARRAAKDASRTSRRARRDTRHAAKDARREARLVRREVADVLPGH